METKIKSNYLTAINNFRIKFSSHANIFKFNNQDKIKKFDTNKLIGLNTFGLQIPTKINNSNNRKQIKYSLVYTNPFILDKNIVNKIKFSRTKNFQIKNLCEKIFIKNYNLNTLKSNNLSQLILTEQEHLILIDLVVKKNKYSKYIEFEQSLLVFWYIVNIDNHIKYKQIYLDLLKYYYLKFLLGQFDFNQIINNIVSNQFNSIQSIEFIKFHQCFYLFVEEFHHKYIINWFEINRLSSKNKIFNSNYIKINPQEILSNCDNQYKYSLSDLVEQFDIPNGHNILFFFNNTNKVFLYDPDISNLSDFYRFKILFDSIGYNLLNVSNRQPIQVITDDANCVFYCLRLIDFIGTKSMKKFSLNELKKYVYEFESEIITKSDMYDWVVNFVLANSM